MNLLGGAYHGPRHGEEPLRIETIYNAERARMKITASYFKIIGAVLED